MIGSLVVAAIWLVPVGDTVVPPPAPAQESAGEPSVRTLVEQAARQYDQGLYAEALASLAQAQKLSSDPAILYDIAQVYRGQGDCSAALAAYKQYLERASPTDPKHDRAVRWAATMQACVDEKAAQAVVPDQNGDAPVPSGSRAASKDGEAPALPEVPPKLPPAPPPKDLLSPPGITASAPPPLVHPADHRRGRILGWSLVAAGGLCEVAAIALQWKVSGIQSKLDGETPQQQAQDWPHLYSQGSSYADWALATAIAGGALGVGGAWVLIGNRQTDAAAPPIKVVGFVGTF